MHNNLKTISIVVVLLQMSASSLMAVLLFPYVVYREQKSLSNDDFLINCFIFCVNFVFKSCLLLPVLLCFGLTKVLLTGILG